jgi:hypothetical protein
MNFDISITCFFFKLQYSTMTRYVQIIHKHTYIHSERVHKIEHLCIPALETLL